MSGTSAISTTMRRELSSSSFIPARQGAEGNPRHSDRNISLFLPGRAKELSAPLYFSALFLKSSLFLPHISLRSPTGHKEKAGQPPHICGKSRRSGRNASTENLFEYGRIAG